MNIQHSYLNTIFWPRLRRNRLAMFGGGIVLLLFIVSLFAPLFSPYDPSAINAWKVLSPPSWQHWFGTDELGRDVLSRVLYGARVSLKVGFVAVGIAVSIGTVVGLVSGYYSGIIDATLMRFVDIMLCFPAFFLILRSLLFWNHPSGTS
jgi:peptide/nickel transport system permease protein